jgi:hypothetical protein
MSIKPLLQWQSDFWVNLTCGILLQTSPLVMSWKATETTFPASMGSIWWLGRMVLGGNNSFCCCRHNSIEAFGWAQASRKWDYPQLEKEVHTFHLVHLDETNDITQVETRLAVCSDVCIVWEGKFVMVDNKMCVIVDDAILIGIAWLNLVLGNCIFQNSSFLRKISTGNTSFYVQDVLMWRNRLLPVQV